MKRLWWMEPTFIALGTKRSFFLKAEKFREYEITLYYHDNESLSLSLLAIERTIPANGRRMEDQEIPNPCGSSSKFRDKEQVDEILYQFDSIRDEREVGVKELEAKSGNCFTRSLSLVP